MNELTALRLTAKVTVYHNEDAAHFDPWHQERHAAWTTYAQSPETIDLDPADTGAVVEVLLAAPEAQRAELAEVIAFVARDARRPLGRSHVPREAADVRATLQVCQFGGITATTLRKRWFHPFLFDLEPAVADDVIPLWQARTPASRAAWLRVVHSLLGERPEWWFVLRFLELRCGADVLHDSTYMRAAWEARDPYGHFRFHPDGAAAVATSVAADPTMALEMAQSLARTEVAEYLGSFAKAMILERLLEWTASGIMPRLEVLAGALAGLSQPQRPGAGAALRRVVQALEPSAEELAPHAGHIMSTLAHGHSSEQAAAGAWLASAVGAGADIPMGAKVRALAAAVEGATVSGARVIMACAKKVCSDQGVREVARAGLANSHDDVRLLCVKTLADQKLEDPIDAQALEDSCATASPRVRTAIDAALARYGLVGHPVAVDHNEPPISIATAKATLAEFRRATPVAPLASVEELSSTLESFLGGGASGIDVELILDGMQRFRAGSLSPDRRDALARTCKRNAEPAEEMGLHRSKRALAGIAVWLGAEPVALSRPRPGRATVLGVAEERFVEASTLGECLRPSLSLPTDSHGTLKAEEFERRLAGAKHRPGSWEEACARARVAMRGSPFTIESVDFTASHTAYGWQSPRLSFSVSTPHLGGAADLRDVIAPPGYGEPGRVWREFMANCMSEDVSPATAEWVVLAFPHDRDLVFAAAADALLRDPTHGGRLRHEDSAVAALTWDAFGTGGELLLVAAWWSAIVGARSVAVDVAGLLAAAGELPADALGKWCARLSSAETPGLGRCAAALAELVEGPGGARAVHQIAEAFAGGEPGVHREVSKMLEVWEVAADRAHARVGNPAARAWLGGVAVGTSKRAAAARRLLALEPS